MRNSKHFFKSTFRVIKNWTTATLTIDGLVCIIAIVFNFHACTFFEIYTFVSLVVFKGALSRILTHF